MDTYLLFMKWDYKYDKESTWFDEESGEDQYELIEGASYTLPHIKEKSIEIRSVKTEGDLIQAEIYVDCKTYTLVSGETIKAFADYNYTVAGDSVSQSLFMTFTIK